MMRLPGWIAGQHSTTVTTMWRWLVVVSLSAACGGTTREPVGHAGSSSSGGASTSSGGNDASDGGTSGELTPHQPFNCGNDVVIQPEQLCDGTEDCLLGGDELDCPKYFCKDGTSRGGHRVCDGMADCPDAEDERDDQCGSVPTGFQCDGKRIPRRQLCDSHADCADGADEARCPAFLCFDGEKAIPWSQKCDGTEHCADGSDELSCTAP